MNQKLNIVSYSDSYNKCTQSSESILMISVGHRRKKINPVLRKDLYRSFVPMVRSGDSQQAHYSFNMIISGMTQQSYFATKMTIPALQAVDY
jgi:hypothetical protein